MTNEEIHNLKPNDVEIINIKDSTWNCDKCIFFKEAECECRGIKRLLFASVLGDDCDDCKRPFVLKTINS